MLSQQGKACHVQNDGPYPGTPTRTSHTQAASDNHGLGYDQRDASWTVTATVSVAASVPSDTASVSV